MVQNNSTKCLNIVPCRSIVAVMVFTACLISYMLRVNMSLNILAMVEPKKSTTGKVTMAECLVVNNVTNENVSSVVPDYGVRYDWDQKAQGLIVGSYFWGYIITSIPGGLLAEKFGPRHVIGVTGLLSGILTILTPVAASAHYMLVIIARFLMGLLGGVVYPALHCLISRWAPPVEKGKFTSALLGGTFGTVITWPILGIITQKWGWIWAFYFPGGLCVVWVVLWYLFISDSPQQHKRITDEELKYIETNIGDNISKTKKIPPYKDISLSIPFWALLILHYGNLWGLYFLLTCGPKFMSEVLGFNLANSGGLASLPYLCRMIFGFIFGSIGDYIRRKNWISVTGIRKWFIIFSHFAPGLLLLAQTLTGCNYVLAILLLTVSLGMNGASTVTNLQNSQDLAPNFAGSLYGIINCIGGTTGFITPILVSYITSERNGLEEWYTIFTIGASVYIASGVVFCIFGSGETQKWNYIADENDNKKTDNNGVDNAAFDIQTEVDILKKLENIETENTKV